MEEAEKVKTLLTTASGATVSYKIRDSTHDVEEFDGQYSVRDFLSATRLLFDKIESCLSSVKGNVKAIVPVGGASQTYGIDALLQRVFPSAELKKTINAQEASVSGAAIIAHHAAKNTLCFSLPPLSEKHTAIQDISSYSVTIGEDVLFPKFALNFKPVVTSQNEGKLMEGGLPSIDIGPSTRTAITHEGLFTRQQNSDSSCTPIHQMQEKGVKALNRVINVSVFKTPDRSAPHIAHMPTDNRFSNPEHNQAGVPASALMTPALLPRGGRLKRFDLSPVEDEMTISKTVDLASSGSGTAATPQSTLAQIRALPTNYRTDFAGAGKYFGYNKCFDDIRYVNEYKMFRDLLADLVFYPYEADNRWSKCKERSHRFLKKNATYLRRIENDAMAFSRVVENLFQSVTSEPIQEEETRSCCHIFFYCCYQ